MPPGKSPRRALHAYVTDTAHDAWHDFGAKHGVSVSAVVEAMAPLLQRVSDSAEAKRIVVQNEIGQVVQAARHIDARRRRRLG